MSDETEPKPAPKPEPKPVWIKCRVKNPNGRECSGTQALLTGARPHQAGQGDGSFHPTMGGSSNRYRCTTCNGTFTIST